MERKDKHGKKPLVVLDFDGTLVPIVRNPSDASIEPSALSHLKALSKHTQIVILTGRPAAFVSRQLGVLCVGVIGLHGNRAKSSEGIRRLLAIAKKCFSQVNGVLIEKKPAGFAVHYRNAPGKKQVRVKKELALFAKRANAMVIAGRKCVEFMPLGSTTKSEVLEGMIKANPHLRILYVGDDISDAKAIHNAQKYSNFTGALVRSSEVRANGVEKIERQALFSFLQKHIGDSKNKP